MKRTKAVPRGASKYTVELISRQAQPAVLIQASATGHDLSRVLGEISPRDAATSTAPVWLSLFADEIEVSGANRLGASFTNN